MHERAGLKFGFIFAFLILTLLVSGVFYAQRSTEPVVAEPETDQTPTTNIVIETEFPESKVLGEATEIESSSKIVVNDESSFTEKSINKVPAETNYTFATTGSDTREREYVVLVSDMFAAIVSYLQRTRTNSVDVVEVSTENDQYITREMLRGQSNRIYDNDTVVNTSSNTSESVTTDFLTVTGNGTIDGTFDVAGALSAAYVSAPYILVTGAGATSTFAGALTVGTSSAQDTLTIDGVAYFAQVGTPDTPTDRLYNIGGDLYWNGSLLTSTTSSNWILDGSNVYRSSGNVGIGDISPAYLLTVGANDAFGISSNGIIATQSVSTTSLLFGGTLTDGYILAASSTAAGGFAWYATSSPYLNLVSGGGGATTLGALTDVNDINTLFGALLSYNGSSWATTSTSSLNISTTDLSEGTNLFFTNGRFDARLAATTTLPGLTTVGTLNTGTLALDSLTYSGTLDDTYINDTLTIGSGSTIADGLVSTSTLLTGGTYQNGYILAASSTAAGGFAWYATSSPYLNLASGSGSSQWATFGSDLYYTTGNVGIGSTTPSSKLTVAGAGFFGGAFRATGTIQFDSLIDGYLLTDASGNLSATSSTGITNSIQFLYDNASATARSVSDKLSETVSVKDFGAVGDGLADDYAAFEAAQNALPDNGGAIYVPAGTYRLSQTINLVKQVHLYGDGGNSVGASASDLLFDADTDGIIVNRGNTYGHGTTTSSTWADESVIENLRIRSAGGSSGIGIWLRARATLRNLAVKSFPEYGVQIRATAGSSDPELAGNANNWRIDKIRISNSGSHGLYVDGADVNAGEGSSIDSSSNGGWGIFDSSFLGNTYIAPHTAGNDLGAYKTDNANAKNVFVGAYNEMGEPPSSLVYPTIVLGGGFGSGFTSTSTAARFIGDQLHNVSPNFDGDAVFFSSTTDTSLDIGRLGDAISYNSFNIYSAYNTNQPTHSLTQSSGLGAQYRYGRTKLSIIENLTGTNNVRMLIDQGNVAIGTTTDLMARLTVQTSGTTDILNLYETGGLEVFTVLENGNVGIGTTSPATKLTVDGTITPNIDDTYTLGNATYRWNEVFSTNGVINTSDRRLKDNIESLQYGLAELIALEPVSFTWKDKPEQGTKLGLIAQDVRMILPEIVQEGDDINKTLGIRYSELLAVVINAIKELWQSDEELRAENEQLKARLEAVEAKLDIVSPNDTQSPEFANTAAADEGSINTEQNEENSTGIEDEPEGRDEVTLVDNTEPENLNGDEPVVQHEDEENNDSDALTEKILTEPAPESQEDELVSESEEEVQESSIEASVE